MEWIKVSDRLPEKMTTCLVYAQEADGGHVVGWCFYSSERKYCHSMGYYDYVTHWMPLPEPPKI